jgi:hypothetical protein
MNEYYSSIHHPSMHECIFSINEYYSFIHAWFIHRFLREKILVIHSSCAWIIHLFTLGSDAYSLPSREEERESIYHSITKSKPARLQATKAKEKHRKGKGEMK